jgi:hypothetical protein
MVQYDQQSIVEKLIDFEMKDLVVFGYLLELDT